MSSQKSPFHQFLVDFAGGSSDELSEDLYENVQSSQIRFPLLEDTQIVDLENETVRNLHLNYFCTCFTYYSSSWKTTIIANSVVILAYIR